MELQILPARPHTAPTYFQPASLRFPFRTRSAQCSADDTVSFSMYVKLPYTLLPNCMIQQVRQELKVILEWQALQAVD